MKTFIASALAALVAAVPAVAQTANLSPSQRIAIANQNESANSRGDIISIQSANAYTDLSTRGALSRAQAIAIANHNTSADGQGDRIVLPND